MKRILIVCLLLSSVAEAAILKNCHIVQEGVLLTRLENFDVYDFETSKPVPLRFNGSLVDYSNDGKNITMYFSNEWDNSYELSFDTKAVAVASLGQVSHLIGEAKVSTASDGEEKEFLGQVICQVTP